MAEGIEGPAKDPSATIKKNLDRYMTRHGDKGQTAAPIGASLKEGPQPLRQAADEAAERQGSEE